MALVELGIVDQRYAAVIEVLQHRLSKIEVGQRHGVTRQTIGEWVKRYEEGGVEALVDRPHKPSSCPHQMPPDIEARVCEMRRQHRRCGPARIAWQMRQKMGASAPSQSAIYRALVRNGLIDTRPRKKRTDYKRWERPGPMQLWQMDIVGGVMLSDGREAKIVTGVDDHSRFCVVSAVVERATGRAVCIAFSEALRKHGIPDEVLTDNGKQFTDRFSARAPAEVLFDKICRENGIVHRLTGPRSPTTTGKIERFHRSMREEWLNDAPAFDDIDDAQASLDVWVNEYNSERPHQSLNMDRPSERFEQRTEEELPLVVPDGIDDTLPLEFVIVVPESGNASLCNQQMWFGRNMAGTPITVQVTKTVVTMLVDGEIYRQMPNFLTPAHIAGLWKRGAKRPYRVVYDEGDSDAIEAPRKINASGLIGVGGKQVGVGLAYANQQATVLLEPTVMHVFVDGKLIKTVPALVEANKRLKLFGAHPAPRQPVEVPQHHEVQRRVGRQGTVNVAKQKLKIGSLHEGKLIDIWVEPDQFKVFVDDEDPLIIKRLVQEDVTRLRTFRSRPSRADR